MTWKEPYPQSVSPDSLAVGFGLKDWNFHPDLASVGTVLTSQTIYAVAVPLIAGRPYTGIELLVLTPGSGSVPTNFFVGLATIASTGVLLVKSSDLKASASLTAANGGVQRFPFSAVYQALSTTAAMAVVLENGAFGTTPIQFGRPAIPGHGGIEGSFLAALCGTVQSALPAVGAALPSPYGEASALPLFVGLY